MLMKVVLEVPHPARVHLFRNLYHKLIEAGHDVLVLSKEKDGSEYLLRAYDVPFKRIGVNHSSLLRKLVGVIAETIRAALIIMKFRPDVLVGGASPTLAAISALSNIPYCAFEDTEHASLTWLVSKPFINRIITPSCFLTDLGQKHLKVPTFKEMAYLSKDKFQPDIKVFERLEIADFEPYIILRFISWGAIHDRGQTGFSAEFKIEAVEKLSKHVRVFISSEEELPSELEAFRLALPPEDIHNALYYACLFFGESGTMATESAVLGTPAVRVSSLAKLLGNTKELNSVYRLLYYYEDASLALDKCMSILQKSDGNELYSKRAALLHKDKVDLTDFLYEYITGRDYEKSIGTGATH